MQTILLPLEQRIEIETIMIPGKMSGNNENDQSHEWESKLINRLKR